MDNFKILISKALKGTNELACAFVNILHGWLPDLYVSKLWFDNELELVSRRSQFFQSYSRVQLLPEGSVMVIKPLGQI